MYMRKILSRILIGCYVMAALSVVGACNDDVDIQQSYPFSIETMPVPKKLKVGETAEIRCQLHRDGRFEETKYFIRYFASRHSSRQSLQHRPDWHARLSSG